MSSSLSDILSTVQSGVIALNNLAAQIKGSFNNILGRFAAYDAAWTAYTPTVTASVGVFTAVSGVGRYKQNGKTVFFVVTVTITTNGAAAGAVFATMPVTALAATGSFAGRENAVTGFGLTSRIFSTAPTQILIQKYDGTYLGANGYILEVCGTYEAA